MTDEGSPEHGKKDPLASFETIPGTDSAAGGRADADVETPASSGTAYEQVRGLLAELGRPVGTSGFSEKMIEEMESFDRRWNERPIPTLVSAGKKMVDQSGSTGLNRLLGLPVPPTGPDIDQSLPDEALDLDAADSDASGLEASAEENAAPDLDEVETVTALPGEGDDTPPRESAADEPESQGPAPEPDEEQVMTAAPTARMVAAQTAYAALNPLEAEIFRSRTGLVELIVAQEMSTRAQELALGTLGSYEREATELRQQLEAARTEAATAAQAAASDNEALTAKVTMLSGQIEILTAELIALRRSAADDGDDSGGGAGRELVKGHDDLRADDEEQSADPIDGHVDDAPDHTDSEETGGPEPHDEEASVDAQGEGEDEAEGEDDDGGGGGLMQRLERLSQGEGPPVLGQDFGE